MQNKIVQTFLPAAAGRGQVMPLKHLGMDNKNTFIESIFCDPIKEGPTNQTTQITNLNQFKHFKQFEPFNHFKQFNHVFFKKNSVENSFFTTVLLRLVIVKRSSTFFQVWWSRWDCWQRGVCQRSSNNNQGCVRQVQKLHHRHQVWFMLACYNQG